MWWETHPLIHLPLQLPVDSGAAGVQSLAALAECLFCLIRVSCGQGAFVYWQQFLTNIQGYILSYTPFLAAELHHWPVVSHLRCVMVVLELLQEALCL